MSRRVIVDCEELELEECTFLEWTQATFIGETTPRVLPHALVELDSGHVECVPYWCILFISPSPAD